MAASSNLSRTMNKPRCLHHLYSYAGHLSSRSLRSNPPACPNKNEFNASPGLVTNQTPREKRQKSRPTARLCCSPLAQHFRQRGQYGRLGTRGGRRDFYSQRTPRQHGAVIRHPRRLLWMARMAVAPPTRRERRAELCFGPEKLPDFGRGKKNAAGVGKRLKRRVLARPLAV